MRGLLDQVVEQRNVLCFGSCPEVGRDERIDQPCLKSRTSPSNRTTSSVLRFTKVDHEPNYVAEIHVEFDNEAIVYEQFSPKRDMTKYGFFDRFKPAQ